MKTTSQTASIAELKRAIEGRDAKALTALYADGALLRIIDHDNPPGQPRDINGKSAIASYFDDVCGRAMSHHIDFALTNGDLMSFTQTCTYPDGAKVFCAAMLEIEHGQIVRQT